MKTTIKVKAQIIIIIMEYFFPTKLLNIIHKNTYALGTYVKFKTLY